MKYFLNKTLFLCKLTVKFMTVNLFNQSAIIKSTIV
jgi:hypothetical protein